MAERLTRILFGLIPTLSRVAVQITHLFGGAMVVSRNYCMRQNKNKSICHPFHVQVQQRAMLELRVGCIAYIYIYTYETDMSSSREGISIRLSSFPDLGVWIIVRTIFRSLDYSPPVAPHEGRLLCRCLPAQVIFLIHAIISRSYRLRGKIDPYGR